MKEQTNSLILNLKNSPKFKKVLFVTSLLLIGLYIISALVFSSGNMFTGSNYVTFGVIGLLGVVTLISTYLYSSFKLPRILWVFPIFVLLALLGTLIYSKEYRLWLTVLFVVISLFVLFYAFRFIGNPKTIMLAIISAFTLFGIIYVITLRKDIFSISNWGRMGDPFEHPNAISAYMVIASIVTLYSILFFSNKYKYLLIIPQMFFLLIGLTTGSRIFVLTFIVVALILLIFKFRKNKWVLISIFGAILLLFVLLLSLPMLSNLRFRLLNSFTTVFGTSINPDISTLQRVSWLKYGFTLGGQKFLFGYGVEGFAVASGVKAYSHSNLPEVLCDFGFIGAILFYLPIGYILYKGIKELSEFLPLIIAGAIYCVLASFTNVFYYNKIFYFAVAYMLYLVNLSSDIKKE